MRRALITGATGQDGSYLSEYLLSLGYEVFGLVRRSARHGYANPAVTYLTGDLLDGSSILTALETASPDEVYNLAADTFVGSSWQQPVEQAEVTGIGCLRVLEAIRQWTGRSGGFNVGRNASVKFYQASTSELYGSTPAPQNEETPFHPRSPYGCAKLYAHSITVNYRESYGMFACCGILFNHESERRGAEFVTQKICTQAAEVKAGKRKFIELGHLEARRDWGYAPEYVRAMHLMLQQENPDDYVVATGETHSVREFLEEVLACAGLDWPLVHSGVGMRRAEVEELRGDASKIAKIGWKPKTFYGDLARMMYDAAWEKVCGKSS
jgi:GDPmannose 4,6-dehydratase